MESLAWILHTVDFVDSDLLTVLVMERLEPLVEGDLTAHEKVHIARLRSFFLYYLVPVDLNLLKGV